MKPTGKTIKEMQDKLGTAGVAKILGCTPRNVLHLVSKSEFEFRFRRSKGKWVWIKYQEGQEDA